MNKIFLVLYPFKFRSFDEKRFEFDLLKKKNKVIVFEFIDLLFPSFSKVYKKEKKIRNLYKINSFLKFTQEIKKLKNQNKEIVILNFLKNDSFTMIFIKIYIKFFFKNKIDFFNPGTSLIDFVPTKHNLKLLKNAIFHLSGLNKILYKIKINFLKIFLKIFNLDSKYIFLSGKKNLNKNKLIKNKKIIKGHSWDFSQILSRKSKRIIKSKYAVYLDAPGPKFLSDSFLFKEKMYETSDHTYPLLNKFFNHVEKKLKLKIVVAPHPKTKINDKSSLFGKRRVISDSTKDLIKYSSFVITRNSTAVAYACYYKKPVILFYTNQTLRTEVQDYTEHLAMSLKLKAINLDNFKNYSLSKILKFDKDKYKNYLYNYCTFKSLNIPNYKIWSNYIFH